jgi:hypothetical protein
VPELDPYLNRRAPFACPRSLELKPSRCRSWRVRPSHLRFLADAEAEPVLPEILPIERDGRAPRGPGMQYLPNASRSSARDRAYGLPAAGAIGDLFS